MCIGCACCLWCNTHSTQVACMRTRVIYVGVQHVRALCTPWACMLCACARWLHVWAVHHVVCAIHMFDMYTCGLCMHMLCAHVCMVCVVCVWCVWCVWCVGSESAILNGFQGCALVLWPNPAHGVCQLLLPPPSPLPPVVTQKESH